MYYDLTTDELQAWLLAQSISDDAVLAPVDEWDAAQALRADVQNDIYCRQYLNDSDILDI